MKVMSDTRRLRTWGTTKPTADYQPEKERKRAHKTQVMYYLGVLYYQGEGVKQSDSDAMRWFGRAAAQGDEEAKQKCDAILHKRREAKKSEGSRSGGGGGGGGRGIKSKIKDER